MSYFYSVDKVTTQSDQISIEKKLLKLDVNLLAVRKSHPSSFLYMFLATTNAFGEPVDSIQFMHGDKVLPKFNAEKSELKLLHTIYRPSYKKPQGVNFLRPDLLILSAFVREPLKPLALKATKGDLVMQLNEPVEISETEYLTGSFPLVDAKDQQEICDEINAIYDGRVTC